MKVERLDIVIAGSCNFCSRGKIRDIGLRPPNANIIVYPNKEVTVLCNENGGGLKACICDDCLEELYAKSKMEQL